MAVDPRSFLAQLTPSVQAELLRRGEPETFTRGADLIRQGRESRYVFVILEGKVNVTSSLPEGEGTWLAQRGPGDIIGEFAAIDEQVRSATVTALGRVKAQRISRSAFLDALKEIPELALALLRHVVRKVREADLDRLERISADRDKRIATVLVRLAEEQGQPRLDGVVVRLSLTQKGIAEMVGVSLPVLTRFLKKLRGDGVIETNGRHRWMLVRDMAALRAEASGLRRER